MSKLFGPFVPFVLFGCLASFALAQPPTGKVSCSGGHCLWLDADGLVRSWGKNDSGQLGSGAVNLPAVRDEAAPVSRLGKVVDVAAGYGFSLALRDDGTVAAWGQNTRGQLGTGPALTGGSPVPLPVVGLRDVRQIAAGYSWAIALDQEGAVWQWGGLPGQHSPVPTPAKVFGLASIERIAAGHDFALALRGDGTLLCWGSNRRGQCGDGTLDPRPTPVPVQGLDGTVTAMAGSESTALARMADGTLRVWGSNATGLMLTGKTETCNDLAECYTRPRPVAGIRNAVQLAAGVGHFLVLLEDGSLRGWGHNGFGELGDGTAGNYRTAAPVVAKVPPLRAVWAGGYRSVGLTRGGDLLVWGWVYSRQATPTSKLHSPIPLPLPLDSAGPAPAIREGDAPPAPVAGAAPVAAGPPAPDAPKPARAAAEPAAAPSHEMPLATLVAPAGIDESAILEDTKAGRARWAVQAAASSEYAADRYNAAQATGPPDVTAYGDDPRAWSPSAAERTLEWIELDFGDPAPATEVRIRQTLTPGTIVKVEARDPDGGSHLLWQGKDPHRYPAEQISWFVLRFPATPFPVQRIRITLDTPMLKGWKEIDAVQLVTQPPSQ